MSQECKTVIQVLEHCSAFLERHSEGFPRFDDVGVASAGFADRMFWLGRDHGLRTIRGMNRLLDDDEGNVALACTLLRAFYELSIRLLWASREKDGWQRLELYFANEIKKWARGCKDSPSPALSKLGSDLLQRHQEEEVRKWQDASGGTIEPAPSHVEQILNEIQGHDAPNDLAIGKDSARLIYSVFYRVICRPAHAHVEPLTGTFRTMYLNVASRGACLATGHLLTAFIQHTSLSPDSQVRAMLGELLRLQEQLGFGNGK